LKREGGNWYYSGKKLNIYAAVDFAFSLSKEADYTAIVVIGIDPDSNVYVLDIDRFKSDKVIEYFNHIVQLHSRWDFRKLRAEVTVAQQVIVNEIKQHIRRKGLSLPVDEFRPSAKEGSKEERIKATLEHRYDDLRMWHREGGWTIELEEELVLARPPHDDIKDALASAVDIAVAPRQSSRNKLGDFFDSSVKTNSRFGGVAFR
jgi:predicted phage terminase large subunit-like protein